MMHLSRSLSSAVSDFVVPIERRNILRAANRNDPPKDVQVPVQREEPWQQI